MNNISWRDWSVDAFAKARKENKCILLCISASWCHWCHTMDKETYSNKKVIESINKFFVSIRVDVDQRPDVNDRYNFGGWPTTVVLNHDGQVILGATYLPPDKMLKFVEEALSLQPKKVRFVAEEFSSAPVKSLVDDVYNFVKSAYDPEHGGFGVAPKFPHTNVLEFLLFLVREKGSSDAKDMLVKTLSCMAEGRICDSVDGGFYRYATQHNWSIPHFEKILNENAVLAKIYLDAFGLTKNFLFQRVAKEIIVWIYSRLKVRDLFAASQTADEAYCNLSKKDRLQSQSPSVDKSVFTSWNAMMISTLCRASVLLQEPKYLSDAEVCFDSLNKFSVDNFIYHCGKKSPVLFSDYVSLISAAIDLYQYTFKKKYLVFARKFCDSAIKLFYDSKGGFWDILQKKEVGAMAVRKKGLTDNAMMVVCLFKLSVLLSARYSVVAKKSLELFVNSVSSYGMFASELAVASEIAVKGMIHAKIIGKEMSSLHNSMLNKLYQRLVLSEGIKKGSANVLISEKNF